MPGHLPEPEYIPPAKVFSGVSLRSEGMLRRRTGALRSLTRAITYRIVDKRLEERISQVVGHGGTDPILRYRKARLRYVAHIAGVLGSCVLAVDSLIRVLSCWRRPLFGLDRAVALIDRIHLRANSGWAGLAVLYREAVASA